MSEKTTTQRIMKRLSEMPSELADDDTLTIHHDTLQRILNDEIEELSAARPSPQVKIGGIISGKVNNAKIEVLMAVTAACEDAKRIGDWYPGPVSKKLDAYATAIRAEEQEALATKILAHKMAIDREFKALDCVDELEIKLAEAEQEIDRMTKERE